MKSYLKPSEIKHCLSDYLKNRPFFLGLIRAKEAAIFQKHIPFKKPVLDYGCGDGFFAQVAFVGQGKIEFGLDIDKDSIEKAKKKKVYKRTRVFDGKKFPFRSRSFNTVVSNCVLEHVEFLEKNLDEVNRVLKPKGKFVTSVMTDKWDDYMLGSKLLGGAYRKWMKKRQVHLNLLPHKRWDDMFKSTGFEIEEKIGYLTEKESVMLDLSHYISSPSLVTKKLLGKWVLFPDKINYFPLDKIIAKSLTSLPSVDKSSAIFYVLRKK